MSDMMPAPDGSRVLVVKEAWWCDFECKWFDTRSIRCGPHPDLPDAMYRYQRRLHAKCGWYPTEETDR